MVLFLLMLLFNFLPSNLDNGSCGLIIGPLHELILRIAGQSVVLGCDFHSEKIINVALIAKEKR